MELATVAAIGTGYRFQVPGYRGRTRLGLNRERGAGLLNFGESGTGVANEGIDAGGIFLAGTFFDATGDVDPPGAQGGDGFGDVFGSEAAGEDDARASGCGGHGFRKEDFVDEGPVDGAAGASGGGGRFRIDEDSVDEAFASDGAIFGKEMLRG